MDKLPLKFADGDVVQLKSAAFFTRGPAFTVLVGHEADNKSPARYEVALVSDDGSQLITCTLPEHALVGVGGAQ